MSSLVLLQGNAARLPLADHSIDTVCTSPPFYGLRLYQGVEPALWPGGTYAPMPGVQPITIPGPPHCEALEACTHDWQPYVIPPPGHTDDGTTGSTLQGGKATQAQTQRTPIEGAFCGRCEAWRGSLGNEPTLDAYIWHLLLCFREVWRVLKPTGVFWVNIGDTYFGDSPVRMQSAEAFAPTWDKGQTRSRGGTRRSAARLPGFTPGSLLLVPYRVALAAEAEGWLLRQDCVIAKQAPMPESVHGWQYTGTTLRRGSWRHTRAHEAMLMLTKDMHYYANGDAVREDGGTGWKASMFDSAYKTATQRRLGQQPREETPGRNPRSVLTPTPTPLHLPHYAAFPPSLIEPLLKATCPERACGACGAPWAPIVTRQRLLDGTTPVSGAFAAPDAPYRAPANGIAHTRYSTTHTMEGLAPTCACYCACAVPFTDAVLVNPPSCLTCGKLPYSAWTVGVCLDPFAGSGTTALVARALGRDAVALDASPTYLRLARERLSLEALDAWVHGQAAPALSLDGLPLFAGSVACDQP